MKTVFKRIPIFFILTILMMIVGGVVLFLSSKVGGHLAINATHTPIQDELFYWITYGGDGLFVVAGIVVLSVLLWRKYKLSIVLLSSLNLIIVGGLVAFFKHLIYDDAFRPIQFIGRAKLYLVPDSPINLANSFPSGHTTAAFAFFALVAYLFPNKWIQSVCVFSAALVGYSRIYLSQHFLEDVVAGAGLGLVCFMLSYWAVGALPLKSNVAR
ncbi:MAG: phosphatase PAP2 family protein [Crocinitomicaceae bacterium]|nr:phosphatase PAP2 family protein [Crocinitomicaceae bacterium]